MGSQREVSRVSPAAADTAAGCCGDLTGTAAVLLPLWLGQLCCRPPPAGRRGRTPRDRPSGAVQRSQPATSGDHAPRPPGITGRLDGVIRTPGTDSSRTPPMRTKKRRPLPERPPNINNQRHVALMNARLLPRNQVGNYRLQLTTTFSATTKVTRRRPRTITLKTRPNRRSG